MLWCFLFSLTRWLTSLQMCFNQFVMIFMIPLHNNNHACTLALGHRFCFCCFSMPFFSNWKTGDFLSTICFATFFLLSLNTLHILWFDLFICGFVFIHFYLFFSSKLLILLHPLDTRHWMEQRIHVKTSGAYNL